MGDDTPVIGKNARRTAFGEGTPLGDDTWNGTSDYLDPLHVFHDTADPRGSKFEQTVGQPGAATAGPDNSPPNQAQAAGAALQEGLNRENRMRSAGTILTGGAGILDNPNVYSASRSLLGS